MKKFFNDNIVWFLLLALVLAAVALYMASRNRKAIRQLPAANGVGWTAEEKKMVMEICNVQNAGTKPDAK